MSDKRVKPLELFGDDLNNLISIIDSLDTDVMPKGTHCITTKPEFDKMIERLKQAPIIAVDTETSGLNLGYCNIVGYCLAVSPEEGYYVPIRHVTGHKQLSPRYVADRLRPIFANTSKEFRYHHRKFDAKFERKEKLEVKGKINDTMIKSHTLDENGSHRLKDLACEFVDKDAKKHETEVSDIRKFIARQTKLPLTADYLLSKELERRKYPHLKSEKDDLHKYFTQVLGGEAEWGRDDLYTKMMPKHTTLKKEDIHYGMVPLHIMAKYGCYDAMYTFKLDDVLDAKMTAIDEKFQLANGLRSVYNREIKVSRELTDVEFNGVHVDVSFLEKCSERFRGEFEEALLKLRIAFGTKAFNPRSTKQIIEFLRDNGVPFTKLTKTGMKKQHKGEKIDPWEYMATDSDSLLQVADKFEHVQDILALRTAGKLLDTYCIGILEKQKDGVLYATFTHSNVKTGRMSSTDPNL